MVKCLYEYLTLCPASIGLLTQLHTVELGSIGYTVVANVDWIFHPCKI